MGTGAVVAINVLFGLLDRATAISALLKTAQSEGRDITTAELDTLVTADDVARAALEVAVAKRKAEESKLT